MAFFPLVLDTSDGNQIKEIPSGSELSMAGVELSGLNNLTIGGALNGNSISTVGDATIGNDAIISGGASVGGNLSSATLNVTGISTVDDLTVSGTLTLGAVDVSTYLVQSDWAILNPSDPAFIKNKPDIQDGATVLNDLTDVQADVTSPAIADPSRLVLGWDAGGGAWVAANPAGGIDLTAFSVTNTAATPNSNGDLQYNTGTGEFTFERADIPRSLADLGVTNNVDESNFSEVAAPARYFKTTAIVSDSFINVSVAQDDINGDQVTFSFNDPGYLTAEADTLDSVVGRGAVTALSIQTGDITATSIDSVASPGTPNSLGYSSGISLDLTADLTSTNGNVTMTNGQITATNGTVTGNIVNATDEFTGDRVNASTAELVLNGTKVTVEPNHFKITPNVTLPSSPTVGDFTHNGDSVATYVNDKDGGGNPGWVWLGGPFAPEGIIFPNKTTTERNAMSAVLGMAILNVTTGKLEVYDGSNWIVVGP